MSRFRVFCVEMFGCGRSNRLPYVAKTPEEAEAVMVGALEEWRQELKLGNFYLCGHSLGAMFAAAYAVEHPHVVSALALASPVGVGPRPKKLESHAGAALSRRLLSLIWESGGTPMMLIRSFGPYGFDMMRWIIEKRSMWVPPGSKLGSIDLDLLAAYYYQN
jgi:pimeloyl-ACP methyl ester carboxylesterase